MNQALDSAVGSSIPTFDSPTLQGITFEQTGTPGVYQMNGKARQFVKFYNRKTYDPKLAEKTKDPERAFRTELFVHIVNPGDKNEYNGIAEDYHKRTYFGQYEAFRDGKTAPEGTDVDDCEFIGASEAIELKYMRIFTVEQLSEASDIAMERLPRGFTLREHAKNFVKIGSKTALLDMTKKLSAELEATKTRLAKLEAKKGKAKDVEPDTVAAELETVSAEDGLLASLASEEAVKAPTKKKGKTS